MHSGSIEVICGPMFSGKTEELIRRLRRADYAKQSIMAFKHASDDRYAKNEYASHAGLRWPCFLARDILDINSKLFPETHVVGIDEAQFFASGIVEYVQGLADRGMRVIIAGLDQDYLGAPFGPMPQLCAVAEQVTKIAAVCVRCGEAATRTHRTKPIVDLVVVGAAEAYEARCRQCHGK